MLNCTDLACVLHHHHFYAHLHHLKHHLQDDDNTAIGDGSDIGGNNNDIQGLLNDTDSELSSLSHLDAPNDVIYMVCGVIIAMLMVGLIIVLVAVTISYCGRVALKELDKETHADHMLKYLIPETVPRGKNCPYC